MTQKLAVGIALVFCAFVSIILLILYYPKDSFEEEFDDFDTFTPTMKIITLEELEFHKEINEPKYELAAQLEEFGAAFLTLLAVGLVTVGLACVLCACCCIA